MIVVVDDILLSFQMLLFEFFMLNELGVGKKTFLSNYTECIIEKIMVAGS